MRLKLFEEYVNSESNKITTLFINMIEMFKDTFDGKNDILSKEESDVLTLIEIEKSTSNDAFEKNIVINFNDTQYYYQITFIVKLEDVKEKIEKAYIKIKIYDYDSNLIREWKSNLDIQVPTDNEVTEEGRFYVKVKPNEKDEEGTEFEYIENFIFSKIGDIKNTLQQYGNSEQ